MTVHSVAARGINSASIDGGESRPSLQIDKSGCLILIETSFNIENVQTLRVSGESRFWVRGKKN